MVGDAGRKIEQLCKLSRGQMRYRQGARLQCRRSAPGAAASTWAQWTSCWENSRHEGIAVHLHICDFSASAAQACRQRLASTRARRLSVRLRFLIACTSKDSRHGGGRGVINMMYLPRRACRRRWASTRARRCSGWRRCTASSAARRAPARRPPSWCEKRSLRCCIPAAHAAHVQRLATLYGLTCSAQGSGKKATIMVRLLVWKCYGSSPLRMLAVHTSKQSSRSITSHSKRQRQCCHVQTEYNPTSSLLVLTEPGLQILKRFFWLPGGVAAAHGHAGGGGRTQDAAAGRSCC